MTADQRHLDQTCGDINEIINLLQMAQNRCELASAHDGVCIFCQFLTDAKLKLYEFQHGLRWPDGE